MNINNRITLIEEATKVASFNNNILFEWATGTGKTFAALKIIEKLGNEWLIVLAERQHIKNWFDEIEKHNMNHILERIEFVLYASIHKYKNQNFYGIVLDEAHHSFSDIRLEILKSIHSEKKILLSATFEYSLKEKFLENIGSLKTIKISLKRAIELGFIPAPKIILHKITLDDNIKNLEFEFTKNKKVKTTQQGYYDLITQSMEYWKNKYEEEGKYWIKMKWLNLGSKRKRFLAECKTNYAIEILSNIQHKRFICFTGSIKQAEQIGGKNIVNSRRKNNDEVIRQFNEGEISNIFATSMLKEGTNLNNIEAGLIIQLSSKLKDLVQMMGRTLRSKEEPEQHIIYIEGTQDEKYIKNVTNELERYVQNR